jgi:hypothetical protein
VIFISSTNGTDALSARLHGQRGVDSGGEKEEEQEDIIIEEDSLEEEGREQYSHGKLYAFLLVTVFKKVTPPRPFCCYNPSGSTTIELWSKLPGMGWLLCMLVARISQFA